MVIPGRKYSAESDYRYGFNGQEKSDEIKGDGNSYTAEFWEYDPRIGRRWNVDPITKVHESPYMAFSGNPIYLADPNGADTTLPGGDGRNITLPTGSSGISTFDGSVQKLQNSTVTVQPASGTLSSFSINGKQFNAQFGDHSGTFQGYYSGDLSYNDYVAQQAASSGVQTAGVAGTLTRVGSGGATGAALPALPLAGFQLGWNYGATHADKVTGWVQAIASTVGGLLGEKVIPDVGTVVAPPPGTPTKVYEIGGWNVIGMGWQTLKYGVASTEYDTYGGAGNRRPDGQLGGIQGEALRAKYPHLIIGQTTISVANSKALAHILENNLVVLYMLNNKGATPPEQGLPLGLGSK